VRCRVSHIANFEQIAMRQETIKARPGA
jgi:hypothetical protein